MSELRVIELWRYPVKSMQGERLERADVETHGLIGDRAWSLVDAETGLNLTARREPDLLMASARLAGSSVDDGVIITLPDGTETADNAQLSAWIGRAVELRMADGELPGTFETQLDETETGSWVQWTGPTGSFHDSGRRKVSLVSNTTLGSWEWRRFRINVILDGSNEDSLVGTSIQLGGCTLEVLKHIDRCVMVTRPQPALDGEAPIERDLSVLQIINRERNSELGIGAVVPQPGPISIGDRIQISSDQ